MCARSQQEQDQEAKVYYKSLTEIFNTTNTTTLSVNPPKFHHSSSSKQQAASNHPNLVAAAKSKKSQNGRNSVHVPRMDIVQRLDQLQSIMPLHEL
jgi:hypothetical protein